MLVTTYQAAQWTCLLLCAAGGDKVDVTPRISGATNHYVQEDIRIEQSLRGGIVGQEGAKWTIKMVMGVLRSMEPAAEGDMIDVLLTFDRAGLCFKSPDQSACYDSDFPETLEQGNILAPIYGTMIGGSARARMSKNGKVESFEGMDAIVKKIERAVDDAALPATHQFFEEARGFINDDAVRVSWIETEFVLYPYGKVSVGDSWKATLRQPNRLIGDLIFQYDCRVKHIGEIDGRRAVVIAYDAAIEVDSDKKPEPNAMGMLTEFEYGEFTGSATYDIEQGLIVRQIKHGSVKLKLTLPQSGDSAPITLDRKIHNVTTLHSLKERDADRAAHRASRKPLELQFGLPENKGR